MRIVPYMHIPYTAVLLNQVYQYDKLTYCYTGCCQSLDEAQGGHS